MGHSQESVRLKHKVFFFIHQTLNFFFKMGKFTLTFIFVTAFIAGTFGAPRTQRNTGCNLNGDVSKNLLELRFDQDRDFKCMRRLLQKGADVNAKDNYDYTPIMFAAKGASNKVSGPNEYPYVNDSLLIIAAQNDHMEIVKVLLEKGANFNAKCHSRSWCLGKDTLIYAATFGDLEII